MANPVEDFECIYDERYYRGEGADPLVDYVFELEHPDRTVRQLEWDGLLRVIRCLRGGVGPETRWLDYGCGNGGLVRHVRAAAGCAALGFETGWIAERARAASIPILSEDELEAQDGTFDVVTAVEVIEHVIDPLAVLTRIGRLLKPGGLLFVTTGNAAPHRDLAAWSYVAPEIHVSFFEPRTLERALRLAGFRPERRGFVDGFEKIIAFKILKALGVRRYRRAFKAVPWHLLARLADARLHLTDHPVGWAVQA